ncbi:antibiotic biosynthesis monooxygenase [Kineosporia sp. NBRC 101677]|uniref:putative quinol monooxygenase n=1 Tax=Kineosporia sp. NBRC 101677 TaxID=3032197 RepID=UPI0024A5B0A8|nr:putative quinol monooxygenase [Kineosporia sp. NBRC 101677]GLY17083.1 antibiotic biosynthesis monooxygenase [Kineosporia sp. NBRC 101677]
MSYVVLVTLDIDVQQEKDFLHEIQVNAEASLRDEPGCLRFDVLRVDAEPGRFLLYEIYRSQEAFEVDHRSTAHYARWRKAAARFVLPGGHVNTYCSPALAL